MNPFGANLGPIWEPTWGPLGASWGPFRPLGRVPFSKPFSTPLRDRFGRPFGCFQRSILSPRRGLSRGPKPRCILIQSVQKPKGFCRFSPFRPAVDTLQNCILKPSLLTCSGRRKQGRLEADLGPNLGPPEGPNCDPNRLPKDFNFRCIFEAFLECGSRAFLEVEKQIICCLGAGPAECAGRRGTF